MSKKQKAANLALLVSIIVLALKAYAYTVTKSAGVLSDAIETIVNVITAVVAIYVIRYSLAPADEEHPYGHGKIEYFSAAFEGGIILFAALAIIFESIKSLIYGSNVQNAYVGIIYIILASIINAGYGYYLLQVGKREKSEALKASGIHLMSDVKTTIGVVIGLIAYEFTKMNWIDSVVAIIVGLLLVYDAFKILKSNLSGLMDAHDQETVDHLTKSMNKFLPDEIIDIHNLRMIRSGSFHHIDAHVVVPQYLKIDEVHEMMHEFENKTVLDYSFDGEFAFHTDPCYQRYCKECAVKHCTLRKEPCVSRRQFNSQHVVQGPKY